MDEEIIRITIDEVMKEIKSTNVDDLEGLCYYCANNIKYYLENQDIESKMLNIRDYTNINYDHYFLIANNKYLIDLTYSQFMPHKGKLRFFKDYPSNILSASKEGREILENLLKNYYIKIKDNYLEIYLNSFKSKEKKETR